MYNKAIDKIYAMATADPRGQQAQQWCLLKLCIFDNISILNSKI